MICLYSHLSPTEPFAASSNEPSLSSVDLWDHVGCVLLLALTLVNGNFFFNHSIHFSIGIDLPSESKNASGRSISSICSLEWTVCFRSIPWIFPMIFHDFPMVSAMVSPSHGFSPRFPPWENRRHLPAPTPRGRGQGRLARDGVEIGCLGTAPGGTPASTSHVLGGMNAYDLADHD